MKQSYLALKSTDYLMNFCAPKHKHFQRKEKETKYM